MKTFRLGPAFGHTTADETRVWIRGEAGEEGVVRWRPGDDQDTSPWEYRRVPLDGELDWVGVTDLPFGESEFLEVEAIFAAAGTGTADPDLPWERLDALSRGRVRRAAAPDEAFSFFLGSCRHRGYGPWRSGDDTCVVMADDHRRVRADFAVFCGDQVYCDHPINDYIPLVPAVGANSPPGSQDEYWRKYHLYFSEPGFRRVLGSMPAYMMFDDHEIRDNWAPFRYAPSQGANANNGWPRNTLDWGLRSYLGYQGLLAPGGGRTPLTEDLASLAARQWWYRFDWGDAQFIVLDTRSDRTPPGSSSSEMLQQMQWDALLAFLREDNGKVKFVVSPVPFAPDIRRRDLSKLDTWRAYSEQRTKLLDIIRKEAPTFPIVLSGDIHLSTVVVIRHDAQPGFQVPCITSSALNWFTFGTQDRGGLVSIVASRLEMGGLATDSDEVRSGDRKGPYRVEPNPTPSAHATTLRNNYVRISVDSTHVRAAVLRVQGEEASVEQTYEVSRAELKNA